MECGSDFISIDLGPNPLESYIGQKKRPLFFFKSFFENGAQREKKKEDVHG